MLDCFAARRIRSLPGGIFSFESRGITAFRNGLSSANLGMADGGCLKFGVHQLFSTSR
jgi:hypothetical protein